MQNIKLIFFVLALFTSKLLIANKPDSTSHKSLVQNRISTKEINLKGQILTASNKSALAFASVIIIPQDGQNKSFYQCSNKDAIFDIKLPLCKAYLVKLQYIGMKNFSKMYSIEDLKKKDYNIVLNIQADNKELQAASITQIKKYVKLDLNKLSYNISKDPDSQTMSTLDMLRKIPMVTVSGDDKIQIKGSSSFTVYLNNKPSAMFKNNPGRLLKTIPASMIKSIEVITDPGVKYSASSSNYILNIITKTKTENKGYSGSFALSAYYPLQGSASVNFNYNKDKYGFNVVYGNSLSGNNEGSYFSVKTKLRDISLEQATSSNKQRIINHNLNSNFYYNLSNKDLLNMNINLMNTNTHSLTIGANKTYKDSSIISNIPYNVRSKDNEFSGDFGLDYQHTMSTPNEYLTLSYLYSLNNDAIRNNNPEKDNLKKSELTRSEFNSHTLQCDYSLPIKKNQMFESGFKFITRSNKSFYYNKLDSSYNNRYSIIAGYLSYLLKVNKYELQMGTRLEKVYLNSKFENHRFNKSFSLDWVPSISLSYNFSPISMLKLHYGFTILRPTIDQLSPYKKYVSPSLYMRGNPDLKPQKNHKLSLTYSQFSNRFSISSSLSALYSNNMVSFEVINEKDNENIVQIIKAINIDKCYGYDWSNYINIVPFDFMRIYINSSIGQNYNPKVRFYNDYSKFMPVKTLNYNLTIGTQLDFNSWTISGNAYMLKDGGSFQYETPLITGTFASISKSFLNRKLNISLSVSNPFQKRLSIYVKPLNEKLSNVTANQVLPNYRKAWISLNYYFGNSYNEAKNKTLKTISNTDILKSKSAF